MTIAAIHRSYRSPALLSFFARRRRSLFSSSSATEVEKFSALSATWWKPAANPLLAMNSVRLPFLLSHMEQQQYTTTRTTTGTRILDVGCGGGILTEALVRRLPSTTRVVGLDASAAQIQAAQHHAARSLSPQQSRRLEYRPGTIEDLMNSSQQEEQQYYFDAVCCLEIVEHVTDPAAFLRAACALIRPDGLLFVSTLNKTPKSFAAGIVGAEYILGLLPVGTHAWETFQSPDSVMSILEDCNMECVQVVGMVVEPSLSMLRGDFVWKLDPNDTDVNWIGCYRKRANKE